MKGMFTVNTSIKKQNRILLAVLMAVLACAAILIAVTGGANKNKKEKEQTTPEKNTEITEKSDRTDKTDESAKPDNSQKSDRSRTAENKDKADTDKKADKQENKSGKDEKNSKDEDTISSEKEDKEVAAITDSTLPVFVIPVDNYVIKGYSADIPVFSYTMEDYRIHNGVDIACSVGTPVLSSADGVVCEAVRDPMMGVCLGISHSGGAVTMYKGLAEETLDHISIGDQVKRGEVIGASGDTALIESAEEGHVHFELSIDGENVDPCEYIKMTSISEISED